MKHDLQLCLFLFKIFPIHIQLLLSLPSHLLIHPYRSGCRRYQYPLMIYPTVLGIQFLMLMCGCQWMRPLAPCYHWEVRVDLASSVKFFLLVWVDEVGGETQELLLGFELLMVFDSLVVVAGSPLASRQLFSLHDSAQFMVV